MRVHSIFQSINGEVTHSHQGSVCTFIRLQGCDLRCDFCDTKGSQDLLGGKEMTPDQVIKAIESLPVKTKNITITGGEPLLQVSELAKLSDFFQEEDYVTTLETNGSIALPDPNELPISSIVMDIKPYSVLKGNWNKYMNKATSYAQKELYDKDWVKFPILTKRDFDHAIRISRNIRRDNTEVHFAFSAVAPLTHHELFEWIMKRKEGDVVLNVQLHKLIGVV